MILDVNSEKSTALVNHWGQIETSGIHLFQITDLETNRALTIMLLERWTEICMRVKIELGDRLNRPCFHLQDSILGLPKNLTTTAISLETSTSSAATTVRSSEKRPPTGHQSVDRRDIRVG